MKTSEVHESVDTMVIGLGLAGACVSRRALELGHTVKVVDPCDDPDSASRVAGGVLDPISGQKFTPAWRGLDFFRVAADFYRRWQQDLGVSFFREAPILRGLESSERREQWDLRAEAFRAAGIVASCPDQVSSAYRAEAGFVRSEPGGWLQTESLLDSWTEYLDQRGMLEKKGGPHLFGRVQAKRVIYCMGNALREVPELADLPWGWTAGEVLDFCVEGLPDNEVFKRKLALIPLDRNRFRLGGTYINRPQGRLPTSEGLLQLRTGLGQMLSDEPRMTQARHRAALRANVRGHLPVVGWLRTKPDRGVLGALGSKGALWAPLCATWLFEELERGDSIPPEVSIQRFF